MNKTSELMSPQESCELCGDGIAQLLNQGVIKFPYGSGADEVELTVEGQVWECESCGGRYTGDNAEEVMHDAVCDYLGRLRPSEIRALRRSLGMTQLAFSKYTDIGLASIKRWESRNQIQSKIYDEVLRYNLSQIEKKERNVSIQAEPIFRTNITDDRREAAEYFRLAA